MMEEWATGHVIGSLHARRDLDIAEGILIGLRRCDPRTAYEDLLGAAKRHGVALMAIASALVDLTRVDGESPSETAGPAHSAARREWGGLLGEGGSLDVLASFAASLGQIVQRAEQLQSPQRVAKELARSTSRILGDVGGGISLLESDQQAPKAPWQSRSEVVSELTRREYEILQLMTKGATNREIATTIFLSEETVKWHVQHILQKFGVANRGQAVATYLQSLKRVECRVAAEGHATRAGWVSPLHVGVSPPNPLTRPRARPTLLTRTPNNPHSLQNVRCAPSNQTGDTRWELSHAHNGVGGSDNSPMTEGEARR
jgi:DNA-binding CsgD family transcriptional regulator